MGFEPRCFCGGGVRGEFEVDHTGAPRANLTRGLGGQDCTPNHGFCLLSYPGGAFLKVGGVSE